MKSRQSGFSLIEVLVATAMLAVIILAIFGLVTAGVRRAYGGKKMTQAASVAQSALERTDVARPYVLLGAADDATTATATWSKSSGDADDSGVTASTTVNATTTALRALRRTSDLPGTAARPATLTVTMTPVPGGQFQTATMVRVVVDLVWWEFGTRRRQVRLQSLNLRVVPS